MWRVLGLALALGSVAGCATIMRNPDKSLVTATQARDVTLVNTLQGGPCKAVPGQGVSACRVKEGAPVESSWRLEAPRGVLRGQARLHWRDQVRTYPIKDGLAEVPLRDLIGHDTWRPGDEGVATALAEVVFRDDQGLERTVRLEAVALIIVLAPSYDPLPFDSGYGTWKLKCTVEYSTQGRSAMECR